MKYDFLLLEVKKINEKIEKKLLDLDFSTIVKEIYEDMDNVEKAMNTFISKVDKNINIMKIENNNNMKNVHEELRISAKNICSSLENLNIKNKYSSFVQNELKEEIEQYNNLIYFSRLSKGNAKIKFLIKSKINQLQYFIDSTLHNDVDDRINELLYLYSFCIEEEKLFVKKANSIYKNTNNTTISINTKEKFQPLLTYKELISLAKKNGFKVDRFNGSHTILKNEKGENTVIPHKSNNKQIGKGLTNKILKEIN